jgi:tRNA threonylcarbamoyl adenosine modification protein YeaZ
MNVLAIDTSVGVSVAILRSNGEVTQSQAIDHGMQGELTAELISKVVTDSGLKIEEISDVVVGVGPGPFTGLRVGLVTASVFAHARSIPIHGICSLDAIAFDYAKPCVVVTDARRKELYWARYEGIRIGEPQVSKPEVIASQFPDADFVGPGASLYPDYISGNVTELKAGSLAKLFGSGSAQLVDVTPMYLRKPDAVEPTTRKSVL